MLINDLDCFIYKNQPDYPYIRIKAGYYDPITEEYTEFKWTDGTSPAENELLRVDRSLLWRNAAMESIPQSVVEDRIKIAMTLAPDIETSVDYLFTCLNCKQVRRRSKFMDKAKERICKKCRYITEERTIPLFEGL